jgi:hypothetical protein
MASHIEKDLIDNQITCLISNAPDLATSNAVTAIAPILKTIALKQKHQKYYLLESKSKKLVVTTLSQVSKPSIFKNVIYAYPSMAIAKQNQEDLKDSIIGKYELVPLLFQILGMQEIDSLILDTDSPIEIERQKLYDLCQTQIKLSSNIA